MGNAATVLSGEEKAAITRALKSKYAEVSENTGEDVALFNELKTTYEKAASDVIAHRPHNGDVPETKEDGDDFDVEFATFSLGKSYGGRDSISNKETETISTMENAGPAKLLRARTSSELLLMVTESVNDDQAKIANFISQLKSGELAPKATSEFRTRRLTFSQNTQEEMPAPAAPTSTSAKTSPAQKPSMKRMQSTRTSIFASSEIGYVHEKKAPFPNEYMGTYSCHGIEPSADEEDGIHEKINQDRGCVVYPYNSKRDECLLMCLDGHGEQGDKVSEFVMRQIVVSLEKDPQLNMDPVAALKNAYITTNTALMVTDIRYMTSGTTCVTIYAKGGRLYVANCGDSRAVMACELEEGVLTAKDLSRDHKPDDPEEQARIEAWGGFVCPPQDVGLSARVYLDPQFTMIGLAMARSIGDHAVKAVGVIPEPEVKIFDVEPTDRFIIMASDGVWEFISSQEAVEIVQSQIHLGCHTACQELIETAAARWQEEEGDYRDDITAVIVKVPLPFTDGSAPTGSSKIIAPN